MGRRWDSEHATIIINNTIKHLWGEPELTFVVISLRDVWPERQKYIWGDIFYKCFLLYLTANVATNHNYVSCSRMLAAAFPEHFAGKRSLGECRQTEVYLWVVILANMEPVKAHVWQRKQDQKQSNWVPHIFFVAFGDESALISYENGLK